MVFSLFEYLDSVNCNELWQIFHKIFLENFAYKQHIIKNNSRSCYCSIMTVINCRIPGIQLLTG